MFGCLWLCFATVRALLCYRMFVCFVLLLFLVRCNWLCCLFYAVVPVFVIDIVVRFALCLSLLLFVCVCSVCLLFCCVCCLCVVCVCVVLFVPTLMCVFMLVNCGVVDVYLSLLLVLLFSFVGLVSLF